MLVKGHRLNCPRVISENEGLRRRINDMDSKTFEAVSSAEQLQRKFSATAEERATLASRCKTLALEVQCMPRLAE